MSAKVFDIRKPKSYGNVTVAKEGEVTQVFLHGTCIFTHDAEAQTLTLNARSADGREWRSEVTKRALNTALEQLLQRWGRSYKISVAKTKDGWEVDLCGLKVPFQSGMDLDISSDALYNALNEARTLARAATQQRV